MRTAQQVSARLGHTTTLYAPSTSDSDADSRLNTPYDAFATLLLDSMAQIGYVPHAKQAWSLHNYSDVEQRTTLRIQAVRSRLSGRWRGLVEGQAPTVFVTEGGARISKMKSLYPAEDPLQAQAMSLQTAWINHASDAGGGAGVDARAVPPLRGRQLRLRAARAPPLDGQAPVLRRLEDLPAARVGAITHD